MKIMKYYILTNKNFMLQLSCYTDNGNLLHKDYYLLRFGYFHMHSRK